MAIQLQVFPSGASYILSLQRTLLCYTLSGEHWNPEHTRDWGWRASVQTASPTARSGYTVAAERGSFQYCLKSLQLWGTYNDVALDNWGIMGKSSAFRAWRYGWSLSKSCYSTVNSYLSTKYWRSSYPWQSMDKDLVIDCGLLLEYMTWICEEPPVKWPYNKCVPDLPVLYLYYLYLYLYLHLFI